jgi:hypothetical protein
MRPEKPPTNLRKLRKLSRVVVRMAPICFAPCLLLNSQLTNTMDPQGIPQFGLVAEEVEEVDPDLVVRDGEGKVNTVRYQAVNAMLLNEFLKEHRKVEELASTVAKQQATIARSSEGTSKQRLANLKQRSLRSSKSRQSKSRR